MAFYRRMVGFRGWKYAGLAILAACAVALATFSMTSAPRASDTEQKSWPTVRPSTARPVAVFLGGSYAAGVGASDQSKRWTSLVSAVEGWEEINLANGGTGYLRTAAEAGCGDAHCPNYGELLDAVVRNNPDIVIVAGGQNDLGLDLGDVRTAIQATYDRIRLDLPRATIIALGPSALDVGEGITAVDAEVRKSAAKVKATYVSLLEPPALSDDMFLAGGVQIGDKGHLAIATRVIENLK